MRTLAAYGPLVGLVAVLTAIASMYVLLGERPPELVEAIFRVGPSFFLLCWVIIDARRFGRVPCYDFGFLVGVFLPVALPWYLVWSRGLRGLLVLGFFLFLLVVPELIASIVWQLRYGPA
ncbi:MAG: hypothetical protein ACLQGP_16185 [Isosphaeraceae bacterium]